MYGKSNESRIFDPEDSDPWKPTRIFSWLIDQSSDTKGNMISYHYAAENSVGIDISQTREWNRSGQSRSAARYLKRIRYGNRVSHIIQPVPNDNDWMFEVVLDYGDHDKDRPSPTPQNPWLCRNDPFSNFRSGFEVRQYRLCQRILMFHHFPDEPDVGPDCL